MYARAGRGALPGTRLTRRHRGRARAGRAGRLRLLISGLCLLCLDRVGPADGKPVGLSAEGPDLGVGAL